MIKANIEYGLRGAFKVDTFDAKGNFVESTDWFDNFITQTGLMYPTIYSFANCFRFLTIGSSNSNNQGGTAGVGTDTTGCYTPFTSFTTSDGNTQNGTWMGYKAYETGVLGNSTCQTVFDASGLRFYRAWSVPSGGAGITVNQAGGYLNLQEFAVSPSSGGDPLGCNAFSRVQRSLPIANGYRAIVSYQLYISVKNYKTTPFPSGTFITGNADITNDSDLITQWGNLSGFYRQVMPGLNCIDYYGVTFTPKYGCGMEPSLTNLDQYFLYFSPDNGAFDVYPTSGGATSGSATAWSSEGVMATLPPTVVLNKVRSSLPASDAGMNDLFYGVTQQYTDIPTLITPFNIRLGSNANPLLTADVRDYSKNLGDNGEYNDANFNYQESRFVNASGEYISFATPGGSGLNTARSANYQQKAIFSTRIYRLPMNTGEFAYGTASNYNMWTGRKKNITRKAIFAPASSLGYNTRFGSMVFSYLADSSNAGNYTFYPIMDSLFYDTSGLAMMQHYRLISGIYLTQRGSGVANCVVSINPSGPNINKLINRKTFQGPLSGYVQVPGWVLDSTGVSYRFGNLISGYNGTGIPGLGGVSGNSSYNSSFGTYGVLSGWGAVIGFVGDDWNNPNDPIFSIDTWYDQGIAEHPTGMGGLEPTGGNPSSLYWPYVHVGPTAADITNRLHVDFHDIVFTSGGATPVLWPDSKDAPISDALLATRSGFCRPTGYILHYDYIGSSGYRLLPNYDSAKISRNNNLYYPEIGGALPAFSFDNGMEVYWDISWASDCGVSTNCLPPPP